MSEFTDTVAKPAAAVPAARAPIHETIEENETGGRSSSAGDDDISADFGERRLPESVKAKIAEMIKKGETATEDAPTDDAKPVEAAAADPGKSADPAAPVDPAAEAKPAETAPDPAAEIRAERDRVVAANTSLLAELETARKGVATPAKTGPDYLEDNNAWLRAAIAAELGVEDPASKLIDEELAGLYADLTAKELGVTPDTAHQAKREAARTRQLLAREKRERKAGEQSKADEGAASAATKKAEEAATFIGNRLQTIKADEKFPLLVELSEAVHGVKPARLIWTVIENGIQTGRFDPKTGDDQLIEAAATEIETRFKDLAAKATKASTRQQTSTATPSTPVVPAAPVSASKDQRQSHGARTLTNADASVAPATTPAKKPENKTDTPPRFKSNKERQDWALRHLPK